MRRRPRVRLEAQMSGGGQERGIRSGTLPTALCVGLGEACRIASEEIGALICYIFAPAKNIGFGDEMYVYCTLHLSLRHVQPNAR